MNDLKLRLVFDMMEKVTAPMKAIGAGSKAMAGDLRIAQGELKELEQVQERVGRFRELKTGLGQTERELEKVQDEIRDLATAMDAVEKPTRAMDRAFEKATRTGADLKRRLQEEQLELQQLRTELKGSGIETGKLGAAQVDLARRLGAASDAVDEQKRKLSALADEEARIANARSRVGDAQARGAQIAGTGAAMVGAGIAMGAPIVAATDQAMDFQATMIDVKKVIDDIAPAQINLLNNGLLDLAANVPLPVEGLGNIAAEAARAGIAADQLLPFTRNAAMMAAALDMTAEESGAMVAQWRKSMDLTIPQTAELADKVNALTNEFGGNAPEVARTVTTVGSLAKISGVASGEVAAMAQLMNAVGVKADVGATGLQNFVLGMTVGEQATKKQAAAFEKLGFDATDMAQRMQTDARGAIMDVLSALKRLPEAEQTSTLTAMFGRESIKAIAPMLSGLDQLDKNFQLVGDRQRWLGSINAEFQVAMGKSRNKVDAAKAAVGSVATTLGMGLLPVIDVVTGKIQVMSAAVGGWMRQHPGLTKAIGMTLAVMATGLVLLGTLAIGIGAVLGPLAMIRFAFLLGGQQARLFKAALLGTPGRLRAIGGALVATTGKLRAFSMAAMVTGKRWALLAASMKAGGVSALATTLAGMGRAAMLAGTNFAKAGVLMLASPLGLVIAAVAALAGSAYLIYRNWDAVKPYFAALWEGVKTVFSGVFTVIKAILFTFTPLGLIYKHWDTIVPWFGALWDGVKSVFSAMFEWAAFAFLNFTPAGLIFKHWDTLLPYFAAIWRGIVAIWQPLSAFFGALWGSVASIFTAVWSIIEQAAQGDFNPGNLIIAKWSALAGWFSDLWQKVRSVFSGAWASLSAMMRGWIGTMLSIGRDLIGGLVAGINAAPGAVWNALKGVVMGGVDRVKSFLGIRSPSRLFTEIGGQMMAGLAVGLERGGVAPLRSLDQINRKLAGAAALGSIGIGTAALASANPIDPVRFADPPSLPAPVPFTSRSGAGQGAPATIVHEGDRHYTIEIRSNGGDPTEIAREVEQAIERLERQRRSDRRADYRDEKDSE